MTYFLYNEVLENAFRYAIYAVGGTHGVIMDARSTIFEKLTSLTYSPFYANLFYLGIAGARSDSGCEFFGNLRTESLWQQIQM